jgi:hypothetical protein
VSSFRIGAGQGFYGDTPAGALEVVRRGEVAYLCCDALAELTMAILQKDRMRREDGGFTRDLPDFARVLLPEMRPRGVRWITNAGGMNPVAAARAVASVAAGLGMDDLRIAAVSGDDITSRLDELNAGGHALSHAHTGAPLEAVRARAVFAVAYLGAKPIVEALSGGADVVITGRVADASLFVAPMVHELGWGWDDWDQLALGVVLGHLMECSGQSTGGNFSGDWWNVPDLADIGYPVCQVDDEGHAFLTKPAGTGGRVSVDTVKEQLLYEVLDPARYLNPDVTADFTSVELGDAGTDRVRISGVRGTAPPDTLKVVLGYLDGWLGTVNLGYSWPHAAAKARAAAELVLQLAARDGLEPLEHRVELIGADSLHGDAAPDPGDIAEVGLRIAARFATEAEASRFPRAAMPLALNGPPFIGGGSTPQPGRALLGIWPSALPPAAVPADVELRTAAKWSA